MHASRISVALVVSALLTGGTAVANPHGARAQAPPAHMSSAQPPPHISHMTTFLPPKRFVYAPYVPAYVPFWNAFRSSPFALGGLGLGAGLCQSGPVTLGDLGSAGATGAFAPISLGAPAFDSLASASLVSGSVAPQAYCQPAGLGFPGFSFDF